MSSIDDVYEPILYQLLEATVSASVGKDKSTRTTVELPSQRVPQIANIPKDQQVAASPPSPEKSKPRAFEKSSKEPEYKQQEVRSLNKNTDFSIPMSDIDQESNDDSFADDKSSEINSIERDSKQMRDEKKKGVSSPKGLFNDDHESDDGKSYDDPEGDDDDIEIGAGSESSASFSLEYGYVEDTKPTDSNGKPKEIADEKKSSGSDVKNRAGSDEKNSASSDSKQSISNGVEKSKPLTTLSVSRLASPDLAPSPKVELESVGLQKLGHVSHSSISPMNQVRSTVLLLHIFTGDGQSI